MDMSGSGNPVCLKLGRGGGGGRSEELGSREVMLWASPGVPGRHGSWLSLEGPGEPGKSVATRELPPAPRGAKGEGELLPTGEAGGRRAQGMPFPAHALKAQLQA